ncbi:serine-rich adhesin for platelets-like [Daktulosphaira vitifoliae]|uniref:serine-rich adhesin for platelets-like n=1 Tax=Daktulosphaira vitifoliae TaxID=58002 RepID=UPI0021AA23CF|nr:serine-rich adhesin for platelets-like [Daktulosphaira vitifoliae]
MKISLVWQVCLLLCISLVLCQDRTHINATNKESFLPEYSKFQNLASSTSQKIISLTREDQIEDEISSRLTTTEKNEENKKLKDNEKPKEFTSTKIDETSPITVKTNLNTLIRRYKPLPPSSSSIKTDVPDDDVEEEKDFTTSFEGLSMRPLVNSSERKLKQRLDGLKGVTTNRGRTRFQGDPGTEIPEIVTAARFRKPTRLKIVEQNSKDEVDSTLLNDDPLDVTTVITTLEDRPKFKKPPLIATHHLNFGSTTETSRKPNLRLNLNLKQKIASSTIKTKLPELDLNESDTTSANKKLLEPLSYNQNNSFNTINFNVQKELTASQQPIPPTVTAWALASLKAPNNIKKNIKKNTDITNVEEQVAKIKPFITWSTRLQKVNENNSTTAMTPSESNSTEFNDVFKNIPLTEISTESNPNSQKIVMLTSTERPKPIEKFKERIVEINETVINMLGSETDKNKYEIYGSQKPEIENTTTIIETLRPSTSTIPSESQESSLHLVTSYKSILENNNTSETPEKTSSETLKLENKLTENYDTIENITTLSTTDNKNINLMNSTEHEILSEILTTTSINNNTSNNLFESLEEHYNVVKNILSTTEKQPSSSIKDVLYTDDLDLEMFNHSSTTEKYIENVKNKLDEKITEGLQDSYEMVDYTSEHPLSSTESNVENVSTVPNKTASEVSSQSNVLYQTSSQDTPPWSFNADTFSLPDIDLNSTERHDDSGEDLQKYTENPKQSSLPSNIQEIDNSENDVPTFISSITTPNSTYMASTPMTLTTTSQNLLTIQKLTVIPTTHVITTSFITTSIPPVTTMPSTRSSSTTLVYKSTTTTSTINSPLFTIVSKSTTTSSNPISTSTIGDATSTTTTSNLISTSTIGDATSTTNTSNLISTSTIEGATSTTTTSTTTFETSTSTESSLLPNNNNSNNKSTITTITTSKPIVLNNHSYLKIMVNSTISDVCENRDDFKSAIVKLFESGSQNVSSIDQIKFINLDEQICEEPDAENYPVGIEFYLTNFDGDYSTLTNEEFVNLLDRHRLDYKLDVIGVEYLKRMAENNEERTPSTKTAVYLSCVVAVCILLVVVLLFIRKQQKRFNYGQRCTPVSLDDYSMDNISVYNSVRRKGALRASKRSYGNPAFDDPTAVHHQLNFANLASFAGDRPAIDEEFSNIPVITVKPDELPSGCETKNRYANVIPLPETRVSLTPKAGAGPNSDYINANFVKGHKGADKFYVACQAPMQSTIPDFWQMIWEQNSRVIVMLTSLTEKGVEKCADYLPPSEVLDCHRLFGDFQVTLKKREVKEKFIVSSLQLKNLESNLWRDITHLWYGGWPAQGVPSDCSAIITFLMETRLYMKGNMGPHVVHCSPGTGRTGTIIACDIAIRDFEVSRNVDIPKTVYEIRRCRAGAVQTRDQYAFIYKMVNMYASKLSGGVLDSI